jgi:hypothetical protein
MRRYAPALDYRCSSARRVALHVEEDECWGAPRLLVAPWYPSQAEI